MATEHDKTPEGAKHSGDGGMSMKDRLMAERAKAAGAPPVPAGRPASTLPSAAAAKPATSAAKPAFAAPKPAVAPVKPAPATPARSALRATAAAESVDPQARRRDREVNPEVEREVAMIRKQQDKWITYGWIVGGALLLIAGVVWFISVGKQKDRQDKLDAHAARLKELSDTLKGFILTNEKGCQDLIVYVDANKPEWSQEIDIKADFVSKYGQAQRMLEGLKEKKDLADSLASIEQSARDAMAKSSVDLAALRRRIKELKLKGDPSPEFQGRVDVASTAIDHAYCKKLFDEAVALAAKGPSELRGALQAFAKAEDEAIASLDLAHSKRVEADKKFYSELLQQIIPESDKFVTAAFPPEVIAATPWLDCLIGDQAKNWLKDGLKGFDLTNGLLHAVGPEAGAGRLGVLSIGDTERWRDYEVETTFTVLSGRVDWFFRLGKRIDAAQSESVVANTQGEGLKAGQAYSLKVTFIGSKFVAEIEGEQSGTTHEARWTMLRKGGIGLSVNDGAEIKISKMRIRVLR